MNIFELSDKDFEEYLKQNIDTYDKDKLLNDLIKCGLKVNKKGEIKMSDYVKKRAVRYRLKRKEIEIFEKLLIDDKSDWLPELLQQYFDLIEDYKQNEKGFTINYGCDYANGDEIYADYILEYEYGASGDYASARDLTKEEYDKYLPMFKEKFHGLDIDELHYVDYCYYNGVDEPAVYDLEEI